jgi:hypothetical protein
MTSFYALLLLATAMAGHALSLQTQLQRDAQLDNEIEQHRLELQYELLSLLGINEPPKLPQDMIVPAYMMSLYSRMSSDSSEWPPLMADKTTLRSTSIRGYIAQHGKDAMSSSLSQKFVFLFTNLSDYEDILHAKLTMLWKPSEAKKRNGTDSIVVKVYQFSKDDLSDAVLAHQRNLSFNLRRQHQWLHFNVRQSLLANSGDSIKFLLKVHPTGNDSVVIHPQDIGLSTYHVCQQEQPLLVVYVHNKQGRLKRQIHARRERITEIISQLKAKRQRRNAGNKHDDDVLSGSALPSPSIHDDSQSNQKKKPCSRKDMNVSMDSTFGWKWVIAPKAFPAYACRGDCKWPLPDVNKTNHAHLQALLHRKDPNAAPRVVCSPWSFEPLNMLYHKQNNEVVYQRFEEMIVTECGCR